MCSIAVGRVKIQTTSENIQRCYTPKRVIGYLLSNYFFSSSKAGKAKRIKKRSARSRSVKQVFLQYKVTNCTMSYDTCTLFARIYTLLCAVG